MHIFNAVSYSPAIQEVIPVIEFERLSSLSKFMRILSYVFKFCVGF